MPDAQGETATQYQIRSIIERVERLEADKAGIADDIKDVYAEAKASGFDTKTLRTIVRRRQMSVDERAEADALLDMYERALGMQPELPGITAGAAEGRGGERGGENVTVGRFAVLPRRDAPSGAA